MRHLPLLLSLLFVVSIVAIGTASAEPQPAPLIANIENRKTISLNGTWHYIIDPYDNGYYNYRHEPRGDGYFLNAHPKSKQDLVEYNFAASDTLQVPGDWNSQKKDLFLYEGTVWYERTFLYHKPSDKRTFLSVGAANYESRVWVNGKEACVHVGGFTGYNCEVTDLVKDGENFVVIYVNNNRHADAVPTVNTDWWNYGGITRDVELVEVPKVFLEDYFLQLKKGSQNELAGWVKMNGGPRQVTVRIPRLKLEKQIQTDANGYGQIALSASGLSLWSPENPKLYDVEFDAGDEVVRDQIGFRTIEVRGQDILLNGKSIFLRGVSVHEEAPYRSGRAFSADDARTLLGWVKEMNGNYVRLAHYPHNRNMTRMADRMGLLVWSEIPVYWTIDWTNASTLANANTQLTEEITRDKNRASIIIWSMGNETPITEVRVAFMRELVKTGRQLDSTRLISAALETHYSDPNTKLIDDPLGNDLDVIGCNEYVGWYERTPEDADRITWKTPYTKPLIMTEFGADAQFGLHGDPDERWTEEYQESVYRHQIVMLNKIPFLRGTTPWILMDFRSPRRVLPVVQDFYNRKGLVSDRGQKKNAFYVMQEFYKEKAETAERP
jgi:beta-glucuronidase